MGKYTIFAIGGGFLIAVLAGYFIIDALTGK